MAGDYYSSSFENPSNRAAIGNTKTGFLSQLLDAFGGIKKDVGRALGFGIAPQDRGSAFRQPDILQINAANTPPASSDYWGDDNPEIARGAEKNAPTFRFLGINTGQASNIPVRTPLFGVQLNPNHTPMHKDRFPTLNELFGKGRTKGRPTFLGSGVSGKKIIQDTQVTEEPSGASSGQGSGGGSTSGGSYSGSGTGLRGGNYK